MSDIENAVNALKTGDSADFRDAVNTALYSRAADALQNKKVEIAQNVFAGQEELDMGPEAVSEPDVQELEDTENADSDTDS